ncbi:MAG: hypothetical protein M1812_005377 [Candelaria pacifica]|nr:MAG: hypothetical protein M1812_005377 [Candelaria pacifica]
MSSGFVSGGTNDNPAERDDEWLKAQEEIEATRRRKEKETIQQDGKTLFDVLQANKVAKQEAFEESIRLKNQFRSLDEDEVEFLDSVLESTRAKEAAVKKETTEQLDLFRKQQEEADKALLLAETNAEKANPGGGSASPIAEEEQWVINGRKRKKGKDKEALKGVKLRKSSSTYERPALSPAASPSIDHAKNEDKQHGPKLPTKNNSPTEKPNEDDVTTASARLSSESKPRATSVTKRAFGEVASLGLGDYSSDDDD